MHPRLALQALLALALASAVALNGWVSPPGRAAAASTIHLSRGSIPAGGSVTVSGTGFAASDLVVVSTTVTVAGKDKVVQSNTTSDANGSFSAVLKVPGGTTQGAYTVTARDFAGHKASAHLTVLPTARITAGSQAKTTYVVPAHRVWVNATGFNPNEVVDFRAEFPLYNGNTTTVQKSRRANIHGNIFGLVLTVPRDAQTGSVTLTATGETSKKSGSTTLKVVYRPSISTHPSTIRPGTSFTVKGVDFVPNSSTRVSVNVTYSSGQAATLSQTVVTDGNGAFSASIFVPAAVRLGNYTVAARDVARGFHATASLNVSVKPTINLDPSTIYPGQSVKVSGTNFGTGAVVHISASVHTSNGTQRLTARAVTGADGSYSATLHIPGNARAGNVVVSARTVNASVQSTLHVHLRPTPAPTAVPTNTPTPLPAPTATPTPKPHHSHALGYRYISIWYHWMRQGTREHVIVQSTISAKQGIWVHVWYPGGQHQAWYEQTDSFGHWEKWFTVPYNSATPRNQRALITFRLWHGKDNVKNFQHFGIVR